jgi:hypothetical protein
MIQLIKPSLRSMARICRANCKFVTRFRSAYREKIQDSEEACQRQSVTKVARVSSVNAHGAGSKEIALLLLITNREFAKWFLEAFGEEVFKMKKNLSKSKALGRRWMAW